MSRLRPECQTTRSGTLIADETALYLIAQAVARRTELIHGRLNGPGETHCAMGCFWADNPRVVVHSALVDEVAAVNDSIPTTASMKERHKKVMSWLRWRLRVMAAPGLTKPVAVKEKVKAT